MSRTVIIRPQGHDKSVAIHPEAHAYLKGMAAAEGVTIKEYMDALLHYAVSCYRRPGSWEGSSPFSYSTYDRRHGESYADRWWLSKKDQAEADAVHAELESRA